MQNNTLVQIVVSSVLVIASVALLNPFHFWMPSMVHMSLLACVLVFFALFAAFVLQEQAGDEREIMLRMRAGRIGYLSGAGVLVLGIFVQEMYETGVDPWLIIGLLAMILGKIISHFSTTRHTKPGDNE